MRTLGIVGGLGPESTIDYYRSIIALYRDRVPDRSYPALIINSLDVQHGLALLGSGAHDELTSYLAGAVEQLGRAGAEVGLISANTAHIVFDAVARRSPIPLISIVGATCDAAGAAGFRRLALLGTGFTMAGGFYEAVFKPAGIDLVVPDPEEKTVIHDKYIGELLNGKFLPETRDRFLRIIDDMRERDGIEAVILAGTELPLLLRGAAVTVPLLDTTEIHVKAAVDRMLAL